MIRWYK